MKSTSQDVIRNSVAKPATRLRRIGDATAFRMAPKRGRSAPRANRVDEPPRRRIQLRRIRAAERGLDRLRERLAELDAPLVERVDAPEMRLHKHLVLVQREQH